MTPIAAWLRETRQRHAMPNGRRWTQDYFLERIKAETGWAPAYPNYNRYEQGKSTPRPDTLQKLVAFWVSQGEPAPDFLDREPPKTLSLEERTVLALERQADAAERQAAAAVAQIRLMQLMVRDDRAEDAAVAVEEMDDALQAIAERELHALQAGISPAPRTESPAAYAP